ncbi:carboxypeptidase regulatory-like domain-containing protein [Flavobacterium sp. 9]|uniref:carboxypeptidase regulatory-like domain-containing protein n=1 Tax=Flavobacterium sp. 9 TaxID=2035198 RepID=UPI000C17AA30|nr:carboxypeptidase regulatory-like domain-containing protein [Flavobacterium sp. 9]
MMSNLYFKFCFLFFIVLSSCSEEKIDAVSYGTVTGKVVIADSFLPMENAKITSSPTSGTVFTDADGKFVMTNVKIGEYSFQAQKDGYIAKYESVTVTANNTSEVIFEIKKSTGNNKAPAIPALTAPTDNAVKQNTALDLTWTATDPDNDVLTFKVTLRNDANTDVKVFTDIKDKKLSLTGLLYGVKYFWQVTVNDGINADVLSAVSSFTTITFPTTRYLVVNKVGDNNVISSIDDAGNKYQLTANETNSWRPRRNTQAKKIAFIRASGGQNHIYTMNEDGSSITKITNSVPIAGFNSDYIGFSWNTSGSQIIYPNFDKLYRINNNGSGLVQIYKTPTGKFISECDWSNDGTKIALKVNDVSGYSVEIYVINMSGTVLTQVLFGYKGATNGLNFSITGQKLLYARDISEYENQNYRQLDSRIFEYNFATSTAVSITNEKPAGTNDYDPRYSPNEAEFIFTNTSNDGVSAKTVMKSGISTADTRVNLFSGFYMPDWE